MSSTVIARSSSQDVRFPLRPGEGSDAVHSNPQYSYAVTRLQDAGGLTGTGLTFTLGGGNEAVCSLINLLAAEVVGREIEELMAGFGATFRALADHPQLRWLGPHKGAVHLALASLTNACFDLWAKSRRLPLWKLLLDLSPAELIRLLDLSYLEDVLCEKDAVEILEASKAERASREQVLKTGYPGYDTSIGWFGYGDEQVREKARRAIDQGFQAFKLKVGATHLDYDLRRASALREVVGTSACLMLDANQQWTLPKAIHACRALACVSPYWIEEPTHPDDVFAHQVLAREIAPVPLALGEHVANRVAFKNYLQAGCVGFVQADCTRVGGVSEFLTVSLLARKFGVPVAPHIGDMGQIHQHLVLFNRIAMGHPAIFLEHIPHLRQHFVHPALVEDGVYKVPQEPGSSADLKDGRGEPR
jgi:L-fuconate dehydratase